MEFKINPNLNRQNLRHTFEEKGFVHIKDVLEECCAEALASSVTQLEPWNLAFKLNGQDYSVDLDHAPDLDDEGKKKVLDAACFEAKTQFSYHFETLAYDKKSTAVLPDVVHQFRRFINSDEMMTFVADVTGIEKVEEADATLMRFTKNHFLTLHDDETPDVVNYTRYAAYILNLSPNWNPDWGGYLQFFDDDGHMEAGIKPVYNSINIFKVPKKHSVSYIPPFVEDYRYSIAGWLRDKVGSRA